MATQLLDNPMSIWVCCFIMCYSVKMPFASIPSKPCTNDVQLQFRLALKWETDEWFEFINDYDRRKIFH